MTPLLEALCDAAKVGFDAPKCRRCDGCGQVQGEYTGYFRLCSLCHATGLDALDPERLIGRAHAWLLFTHTHPNLSLFPKTAHFTLHGSAYGSVIRLEHENHDGTPTGLATALLRLVARAGEAK